jgi:putative membrane protein
MWGYGYTMMGSGWFSLVGALLVVLIVLAVIVVLRVVPRSASRPSVSVVPTRTGPSDPLQTPRQVLEVRYARGDITTDEFRERLQNLGSR